MNHQQPYESAAAGVGTVEAGPDQVSRSVVVNAPVPDIFGLVADPRRHGELDGSGSVRTNASGPPRLSQGATFTTSMKMFGLPYRITSRITEFEDNRLIQWRHPAGHSWRWEFDDLDPGHTRVTETFDYRRGNPRLLRLFRFDRRNAAGIEATLAQLRDRFAAAG